MEEPTITSAKKVRLNDQIKCKEVRLIDNEGNQVGVVEIATAKDMAKAAGFDLVEISPTAEPPVCRIMDYGKYLFEQKKKQNAARKNQKRTDIKEVKLRLATEEGDLKVKVKSILKFLEHGDKVKISLRFRGREFVHSKFGYDLMERIASDTVDYGIIEQAAKMEGKQMLMVLGPKKK